MKKSDISTVAMLIVTHKMTEKCPACGRVFQWSENDDCYIYLPDGSVRFECPYCGQAHDTSLRIEKVKEEG